MRSMDHFEATRGWLKTAGGIAALIAVFAVVGQMDHDDAKALEALKAERAASLAASLCLPQLGQETRWQWQDANGREPPPARARGPKPEAEAYRLVCEIRDTPAGYARAPAVVMTASPAGLDRLALWAGSAR